MAAPVTYTAVPAGDSGGGQPTTPEVSASAMKRYGADFQNKKQQMTREEKKTELLQSLQTQLEDMNQTPISEATVHESKMGELVGQVALNFTGFVIFVSITVCVQMAYSPSSVAAAVLAILAEALLFTCSVIGIWITVELCSFQRTAGTWLDSSQLLRRLRGRRQLRLASKFDLFALTHAMNKGERGLRLDMVRSEDMDVPPKILTIHNEEIEPELYWVEKIIANPRSGKGDLLAPYIDSRCLPCTFFDDDLVDLKVNIFPCMATLKSRMYWEQLKLHPVVSMLIAVQAAVLVMLPNVYLLWTGFQYWNALCSGTGNQPDLPVPPVLEDLMSTKGNKGQCSSLRQFMSATGKALNVSDAEWIFSFELVIVVLVLFAVSRQTSAHMKVMSKFIQMRPLPVAEKFELRQQMQLFVAFLSVRFILERVWALLRSLVSRPHACGPWSDQPRPGQYNKAFKKILTPIFSVLQDDDMQLWELPIADDEHKNTKRFPQCNFDRLPSYAEKCKIATSKWNEQKFAKALGRSSSRYKLQLFVPITCKEALHVFKREFLFKKTEDGGYASQLRAIFEHHHIQDNPQPDIMTYCAAPFRMGGVFVPPGFQLTHISIEDQYGFKTLEVGGDPPDSGDPQKPVRQRRGRITSLPELESLLEETQDDKAKSMGAVMLKGFEQRPEFDCMVILTSAAPVRYQGYGASAAAARTPTGEAAAAAPRTGAGPRTPPARGYAGAYARGEPAEQIYSMSDLFNVWGDDATYSCCFIFQMTKDWYEQVYADKGTELGLPPKLDLFMDHIYGNMEQMKQVAPKDKETKEEYQALLKQCKCDIRASVFGIVEKENMWATLQKVKFLCSEALVAPFFLIIVCAFAALFVPLLRKQAGGEMFPAPYTLPMMLNAVAQFWGVWFFLSFFQVETNRLHLIKTALEDFEMRTHTPPGTTKPAWQEQEPELDPFTLYINETDSYQPGDPASDRKWKRRWRNACENVERWGTCQVNLRVLVSTSRFTSQTMVSIAFIILAGLLLMSFMQAVQGKGMVSIDREALMGKISKDTHAALNSAVQRGNDAISGATQGVADGVKSATERLAGSAARRLAALAAGGLAGRVSGASAGLGDLAAAAAALRAAVRPFRDTLRETLDSQSEALLEEYEVLSGARSSRRLSEATDKMKDYLSTINGIDAKKCTKTQALTLLHFILISLYSFRLVLKTALINEAFDRHEAILVDQKQQHRLNHTAREEKLSAAALAAEEEEEEEAAEEGNAGGGNGAAGGGSASDGGEGGDGGGTDAAAGDGSSAVKDPELKRYEKTLDMAIESSANARRQYPLQLFGHTINVGLLLFWAGVSLYSVSEQVLKIAPPLMEAACSKIENSWVLELAQERMDTSARLANGAVSNAAKAAEDMVVGAAAGQVGKNATAAHEDDFERLVPHISLKTLFHQSICQPLVDSLTGHVEALQEKAEELKNGAGNSTGGGAAGEAAGNATASSGAGDAAAEAAGDAAAESASSRRLAAVVARRVTGRRLAAQASLPRVVEGWWDAHPGDPQAKHLIAQSVLEQLGRSSHRLLVEAPAAVLDAYLARGLGAAMDVSIMHQSAEELW